MYKNRGGLRTAPFLTNSKGKGNNMMKIKVKDKEYTIQFVYIPTVKSRLLSRFAKMAVGMNNGAENNLEQIEDMLLFLQTMDTKKQRKRHSLL